MCCIWYIYYSSPLLLALVEMYRKQPSSGCVESVFAKTGNGGSIAMSRDAGPALGIGKLGSRLGPPINKVRNYIFSYFFYFSISFGATKFTSPRASNSLRPALRDVNTMCTVSYCGCSSSLI